MITPTDDIVGPVVAALASALSSQVAGTGRMYLEAPDGPPETNSTIFPLSKYKFEGDTNGKLYIRLTIGIRYMVRRSKFSDNLKQCYTMFSAYVKVLSSLSNQDLGGLSITCTPKDGGIIQFGESMQPFVCMILNTDVLCEINLLQ